MRGRPRILPTFNCQHCGAEFRGQSCNVNKFCSVACATAGRNDLRSPEFREAARKLWDDGYSMAQVGTLLGVSKHVISGVVWRNNFTPAHLRGRVIA